MAEVFISHSSIDKEIAEACARYPHIEPYLAISDDKTMISMVRSNGGVIYMDDGIVVKKWSGRNLNASILSQSLNTDAGEITLMESVRQTLVYECSILIIFLIIILFRYVCGIIYGKKFKLIQLPKINQRNQNEVMPQEENENENS